MSWLRPHAELGTEIMWSRQYGLFHLEGATERLAYLGGANAIDDEAVAHQRFGMIGEPYLPSDQPAPQLVVFVEEVSVAARREDRSFLKQTLGCTCSVLLCIIPWTIPSWSSG